jgi:hypothetical protein
MRLLRMAILGLLFMAATSAPVAAAGRSPSGPSASTRQCGYVLDRIKPGETSSDVLRQACSSSEDALVSELGVQSNTLLIALYSDANYGGFVYNFWGAFGPCDSAGYGIRNLAGEFNDRISSWQIGSSSCSGVYMYTDAFYSGQMAYWHWYTQVPYVGDAMNDRISSIHINYEP